MAFVARIARLLIAAAAVALAVPGDRPAREERTLTFTTGPISVEAYGVAQQPMLADSPAVDGYVVGMDAEVVDAAGKVQGRDKVMLHHIVFAKIGVPDYTCGGAAERFFAEGEERLALSLPRGYGYPNKATDRWGLLYMLMNHKPQRLNGYIRYRVRYVTGDALKPVKPVWLDVRNCSGPDPVFDVPGGGKRFSTFTKTADFTMPESGRLVSGGGHLHGGGIRVELRNATCGTRPVRLAADLGRAEAQADPARAGPDEDVVVPLNGGNPGRQGPEAPSRGGLRQRQVAHPRDGDHAPLPRTRRRRGLRRHPDARRRPRSAERAATVLHAAAPRTRRAGSRPRARRGSATSATAPSGSCSSAGRPSPGSSRAPSSTTSPSSAGPRASRHRGRLTGTFTHRFTKAGTYRLFCSLHPAKMVQQITVR